MEKHIFISDIHGENLWKKVVEKESDKYIFLGDYFDSFTVPLEEQLNNFKELLYFGVNNRDKVIFLLGNHDIHYLLWNTPLYESARGSGFNPKLVYEVNQLVNGNSELFQLAYQKDNLLCTHAGLRQDYYDVELKEIHEKYPEYSYADLLNMLWREKAEVLVRIGRLRGGWNSYGGVFWCDRRELIQNPLKGFTQVVGHTPLQDIDIVYNEDSNSTLIFTDCIIYNKEKLNYYEAEF